MALIYCSSCGHQVSDQSRFCPNCGAPIQRIPQYQQAPYYQQPQYAYGPQNNEIGLFDSGPSGKSRGTAALLALFLGGFGIHYFYLGKAGGGFICLLLSLVTCGLWCILTFIQGILFFAMKQEEFENKFVYSSSTMPLF